jgi:isocitrate dehydrogenase kinase/phosphatase
MRRMQQAMGLPIHQWRLRANFQIQVLSSLFYRNKGAYLVGKVINGFTESAVCLPILHGETAGSSSTPRCSARTSCCGVQLCARLLHGRHGGAQRLRAVPAQPDAAQAARRALQRAGPAEARQEPLLPRLPGPPAPQQRPLPHRAGHQGHGDAGVRPAVVPYVFKVIKDFYPPQKDTTREQIQGKYLLVKQHDRVGRMADTLEYSNVAFPRGRFEEELIAELRTSARAWSRRTATCSSSATCTSSGA